MRFAIYGKVVGTKYLGIVVASSEEEAQERAWDELSGEMSINLCHHCSGKVSDGLEIEDVIAEPEEDLDEG